MLFFSDSYKHTLATLKDRIKHCLHSFATSLCLKDIILKLLLDYPLEF